MFRSFAIQFSRCKVLNKVLLHPLGNVLLSQDPAVQVPSALEGLTVVFEMGTRGSPPPSSPNDVFLRSSLFLNRFSKRRYLLHFLKEIIPSKLTTSEQYVTACLSDHHRDRVYP